MVEGARNALLGYLYQLLCTASVRVRNVEDGDSAWALLLARLGEGVIRSEEFGQDVTIRSLELPTEGIVAIQLKHSAETGKVINQSELIDILFTLDRSKKEAEGKGETINEFVLISNCHLHSDAERLITDAQSSVKPPKALLLRVNTNAGRPIAGNVNKLRLYDGNPKRAAQSIHTLLKAFKYRRSTIEDHVHRLRAFAAQYGVLEREWQTRLDTLIGAFVRETANEKTISVTQEWLKTQLVGDPNACSLQFGSQFRPSPHISEACIKRLKESLSQKHWPYEAYYLVRDAQRAIRDELASNPIVFVYGDGGCGKSLAVAEYLLSVSDRQFVWSESASTASEAEIAAGINGIRLPGNPVTGLDYSLSEIRARLNVANPGARPIWTIDLDGIDEAPDRLNDLYHLIRKCWANGNREHSPASLVITCRSPAIGGSQDRTDLVNKWLNIIDPALVCGVGFVSLGFFLPDELVRAARLVGGHPETRIVRTLTSRFTDGQVERFTDIEPISPEMIQSLQHPVVWGTYASFSDVDVRNRILDQEPEYIADFCNRILRRFFTRCRRRRAWSDNLMIENALASVAKSLIGPPPYTKKDWELGCGGYLGDAERSFLYHECLTYGLIQREAGAGWRWRHQFIVHHMVNSNNP
jgi:hypothetical protein